MNNILQLRTDDRIRAIGGLSQLSESLRDLLVQIVTCSLALEVLVAAADSSDIIHAMAVKLARETIERHMARSNAVLISALLRETELTQEERDELLPVFAWLLGPLSEDLVCYQSLEVLARLKSPESFLRILA
jgi:hypothetical protein